MGSRAGRPTCEQHQQDDSASLWGRIMGNFIAVSVFFFSSFDNHLCYFYN